MTDKQRWLIATGDYVATEGSIWHQPNCHKQSASFLIPWLPRSRCSEHTRRANPFLSVLLRDRFEVLCSLRNTFLSQSALGLFTSSCWRLWRLSAPPLSHHLESREIFLRYDAFHLVLFSPDSTKLCIFIKILHFTMCALVQLCLLYQVMQLPKGSQSGIFLLSG